MGFDVSVMGSEVPAEMCAEAILFQMPYDISLNHQQWCGALVRR